MGPKGEIDGDKKVKYRQADVPTEDRWRYRQTGGLIYRQTDRRTDRQMTPHWVAFDNRPKQQASAHELLLEARPTPNPLTQNHDNDTNMSTQRMYRS